MRITLLGILRKTTYVLVAGLVILLLITGTLWWKLGQGIDIAHFDLGPARVENLFIKFDQGLIILSDEINIIGSNTSEKNSNLDNILPYIKKWGHLIREIDIRRLFFRDQAVGIAYRNGSFHVRGDKYFIEASITQAKGTFHVDLARFEIIPYKVTLTGKASYTRANDQFLFSGAFETPWVHGSVNISEKDRSIAAEISTDQFTDLAAVLGRFPIDEDIVNWVSDNISAQHYQVKKLHIQFSLEETNNIRPEDISGSAVADSASIRFHQDLEPVQCDTILISFKNDRLSFALDKPTYKDKILDGSKVYIDNIIQGSSKLVVIINTASRNDSTIDEILEKYGIYNLAKQQSGLTQAHLELIFALPGFNLSTKGTFSTGAGEWTIEGVPFHTEGATVQLRNNLITIQQANILYKDILRTGITGEIDISSFRANLQADLDSVNLKAGDTPIINASDLEIPMTIDYGKESVLINLKELNTSFTLNKDSKEIDINSLKAVSPFVPFLQNLQYTEGNLQITTQNMANFEFNGTIGIPNEYLSHEGVPINLFKFDGTISPGSTTLSLNNNSIIASITDKISVNLQDILVTVDTNKLSSNDAPQLPLPMHIEGKSSRIRLKKGDLLTKDFLFKSNGSDMEFVADLEEGKIHFHQTPQRISFVGKDLDAQLAESFIQSADMENGKLNVTVNGNEKGYNGYLEIKNVLIRDYLIMNNLLAFLNAIPALATFSSPGFDGDGYQINDSAILFDLQDKLLTIRQLRTDGTTVDCEAHGWIDFNDRTLNIKMELITLKDYSKILDNIPLVGYAILGKDGSLSTSLDIKGNLDDPEIKTYLTQDILMTPFNIIKRTIKWPFKVFDDLTD